MVRRSQPFGQRLSAAWNEKLPLRLLDLGGGIAHGHGTSFVTNNIIAYNWGGEVYGSAGIQIAKLDDAATLSLTGGEIQGAFDDFQRASREASDLRTIADLRQSGIEIGAPQSTRHYLLARERTALVAAAKEAAHKGFTQQELSEHKDSKSRPFFVLVVTKKLTPRDLDAVFAASKAMTELAREHGLHYDGWDAE